MKTIVALAMALTLFGFASVYHKRRSAEQDKTKVARVDKKAERESARRVRTGLGGTRKTIPQEVLETQEDLYKRLDVGLVVLTPNKPFNAQDYLNERACAADLILVGVVNGKKGQLTDDETFVFSNYQVSIETIIKNASKIVLSPKGRIDVSRLGGEVAVQGYHVRAISQAAHPLEVGNRYLLFLTYLPETNSFVANNLAFLIEGNKIAKLTDDVQAGQVGNDKEVEAFIAEVKDAAISQCIEGSGQ